MRLSLQRLKSIRLSLRVRLLLGIVLPLLIAILLTLMAVLASFESRAEERMQQDIELIAEAIQMPVTYSMQRDRRGSVHQALESVFQLDQVYGAYVYDADGQQIAAVGAVRPRQRPDVVDDSSASAGDETGQYEEIDGRDVYSHYVVLADQTTGQIIGWLQVTRRASDFQQHMRRIQGQMLLGLLVGALVVGGLVMVGHHRVVGRHLERMSGTMARIEQGERGVRTSPGGPRELHALAQSLNTMLDSVERAEQEIQERRHTQLELEERLRHSEKLAAIGRLAAGIAHELGAPLSVVDGRARRVLRNPELSGKEQGNLRDIRAEVQRMSHIVRQLLDFARTPGEDRQPTAFDALVIRSVQQVQELAEARNVRLEHGGPEAIPEVQADRVRIEQVLVNLLRNALQAEGTTRVRVQWEQHDDGVLCRVEDDGVGIEPDDRPRLFEPFFTTKSVGEGTGLGLAVAHGIISEHRGWIDLDTGTLGGACFVFWLPFRVARPEKEEERA